MSDAIGYGITAGVIIGIITIILADAPVWMLLLLSGYLAVVIADRMQKRRRA